LFDVAEQHYCEEHNSNEKVKVTRAVIGVPAYFTEAQRRATIRASELAGVDKVKLLPEPEAAALAYGNVDDSSDTEFAEDELILVFDLGGGTFDVSILEVGGGFTEVLATVGNNRLGGTDFDRRVAEYLSGKAVEFGKKSSGIFVKDWYRRGSGEIPDIILRVAEEVRICLSNQKIVEILVPLTEEGWRKLGGGSEGGEESGDEDDSADIKSNFIGPFDTDILESTGWVDGQDYIVVTLDRKIFETICANELQMLLQPIREVAIMAGALLPGEARPSFVENALAMEKSRSEYEDGEDFWEFDDEADEEEGLLLKMKGGREVDEEDAAEALSEQALEQIQLMDLKAQKKAQQRGRRKARDIDKKERSFRKQKQSAMEDATTASLLGKQQKKKNQSMSQQALSLTEGTKKVQEGIHGRVLSRIVLVGGATRMPVIGKLLEAVVGQTPQRTVNPDEAVALGCAVQAGILDGEDQGQTVLSPMAAAVMRALAKKRGMMVPSEDGEGMMMEMGGGISGMIVDEFDDEDDFY
jgi:molecular chaperone DnaK (HSP70)